MLQNSPQAMALSKQAVWGALERGYRDALEHAWSLLRIHWGHPDFEEGPRGLRREARSPCGIRIPTPASRAIQGELVNFGFSREEEAFRAEVVEFLADYRDLDGFFLQGHKWSERVKALFSEAMGERGWLSLGVARADSWAASGKADRLRVHPVGRGRLRAGRPQPAGLGHRRQDLIRALRHAGAEGALAAPDPQPAQICISRSATRSPRPAPISRASAAAPSSTATTTS